MTRLSFSFLTLIGLIVVPSSIAQKQSDTRLRIASPNGQIVFILSDAPHTRAVDPASNDLRYSIDFHTKWLMDESVLGLKLEGQPPLGSGMKQIAVHTVQSDTAHAASVRCNDFFVDLADDSGRKLTLEVRAYDDGLAFRYLLLQQPAQQNIRVERELTQFIYNKNATVYPSIVNALPNAPAIQDQPRAVSNVSPQWLLGLPLISQVLGVGWVSIDEAKTAGYPALLLRKEKAALGFHAEFAPGRAQAATAAKDQSSLSTSWRVLAIGDDRARVASSDLAARLKH